MTTLNKYNLGQPVLYKGHTAKVIAMWLNDDGTIGYEVDVTSRNKLKGVRSTTEANIKERK